MSRKRKRRRQRESDAERAARLKNTVFHQVQLAGDVATFYAPHLSDMVKTYCGNCLVRLLAEGPAHRESERQAAATGREFYAVCALCYLQLLAASGEYPPDPLRRNVPPDPYHEEQLAAVAVRLHGPKWYEHYENQRENDR